MEMEFNQKNYQIFELIPGYAKLQFCILDCIINVGKNAVFEEIRQELINHNVSVISLTYHYNETGDKPQVEFILRYNDNIIDTVISTNDYVINSSDLLSWYYKDSKIYFSCEKNESLRKIEEEINDILLDLSNSDIDCFLLDKLN